MPQSEAIAGRDVIDDLNTLLTTIINLTDRIDALTDIARDIAVEHTIVKPLYTQIAATSLDTIHKLNANTNTSVRNLRPWLTVLRDSPTTPDTTPGYTPLTITYTDQDHRPCSPSAAVHTHIHRPESDTNRD
ncbi:hypothetical protein CSQ85_12815 [Bifidobacterium rousetti]|uniref:hypothetical protein n=1 Tax=Bifidobacterium rousetti TaxID=2045439 RepID=UPI00123B6274|nr:hypothetical protein [Bifidobacterium rousetti]KAA8815256.1 hypothetical protein CSQ85_12815 [Bifidobacterium rousetti]